MEPTRTEYSAFWAVEIRPGNGELLQLEDGEALHVTMVTLGPLLADRHERTVVTVEIGESGKKYALCSLLPSRAESHSTDLTFTGEESIRFAVTGKNAVHLVGSFAYEDDDEDSEDEQEFQDLADLEQIAETAMHLQDEDDEDEEGDEDDDMIARKLIKEDPPFIEELKKDKKKGEEKIKLNGIRKKKEGKKKETAFTASKIGEVKKTLGKLIDGDNEDEEMEDAVHEDEKVEAKAHQASRAGGIKKRARDQDGLTPPSKKSKTMRVPTPAAVKHLKSATTPASKRKGGLKEGATEGTRSKNPKKETPASPEDKTLKTPVSKDKNPTAPLSPDGTSSSKKKRKRRRNRGKGPKPDTQ